MFKTSLSPLKIFAGTGAVLLVLLLTLGLSFQRFTGLTNATYWDVHTYKVLLETSNLIRGLVNIQSGSRGFVQSGEEEFLQPCYAGIEEFNTHYSQALELTKDNPTQQKRLQLLKRQYDIWMKGHIEPLIKMRRSTPNTQTAIQKAGVGIHRRKIIMDSMRQTVASIENDERKLLAERTRHERNQLNLTKATLLYNGIFAVALAIGLSLLLVAGTRKMELLNRRLKEQIERAQKAEREARVFNNHNKMLLESTRDGIIGVNLSGKTTFFNPAAEAITGWKEEEVFGKQQHTLLHYKYPDGSPYPAEACPIMTTIHDGAVRHADNEVFWHKNGRPIPVEFTSSPLMVSDEETEESKQVGAVIVFRDITERKKAEAKFRELASIVTYANDAIISFKLDGAITSWNRAATKIYGFPELEMIGQFMDRLLPPGKKDELPALIEKIKRNEPVESYQTIRMRHDGKRISIVLSLAPIKDHEGRITGISSISREVQPAGASVNVNGVAPSNTVKT